jgi:predicted permease
MQLHVELRTAAEERQGLEPERAAIAARRRFGNQLRLAEESRDMWGYIALEQTGRDVRYALRHLAKRPTWTATIVLTLAIGIGANASIFALINAILFAPIAGVQPDRLVWLSTRNLPSGNVTNVSYPDYVTYRDRTATLSGVLAYSGNMFSVGGRPAARVFGGVVSGNYFDVLGINAALGRMLRADDDRPGASSVAVLSDALWRERFDANPGVVNSVVSINGNPFVIVGVAPAGFVGAELGEDAELWVPIALQTVAMPTAADSNLLIQPDADWLLVIGRLRDGITIDRARAELVGIGATLRPPGSPSKRQTSVVVSPGVGGTSPSGRADAALALGLLSLVPLLVLLVACSNVANVIMANNVARRREFGMRRAIGASRGRLIRQLLSEALILALAAAAAGLVVSNGLSHLVGYLGDIPSGDLATILGPNPRVLLATTLLAMATVVLFGLLPAMATTRLDLISTLKEQGDRGGTARGRLRTAFVVVQVAVSVTLLIVAGLFLQSLSKSFRVDAGLNPRGAASFSFDPKLQGYSDERQSLLMRQLLDRAGGIPGVTSAAITNVLPLSGVARWTQVRTDDGPSISTLYASVSPQYFETIGTPLAAGRTFTDGDTAGSPSVTIVNEALAARLWPNQNPIGKRLRRDGSEMPWIEVVGVAHQGKYGALTESPQFAAFVPIAQHPSAPLSLVARTTGDVSDLTRALAAVAAGIDPNLPIYRAQPLESTIHQSAARQQAVTSLLAVLGTLTLLLAAIGLYGVAAHSASLRTREVGIRMALGARPGDVARLFVGGGLVITAIGVGVGLAISAAASRLLSSFLFGLTATDSMTFVGGAGILCVVAAVASYVPARRAARLDPSLVLKQD